MIRPMAPDDIAEVIAIAKAIEFQPNELDELSGILADYFSSDSHSNSDRFWIVDDDGGGVGVAYCEPERMTNGTWNLLFLAIRPDLQGQGRGTALIQYVEETLRARGARLLLVETLASLKRSREFYCKCGYDEEARIRDFYEAGVDKIVYRKAIVNEDSELIQ